MVIESTFITIELQFMPYKTSKFSIMGNPGAVSLELEKSVSSYNKTLFVVHNVDLSRRSNQKNSSSKLLLWQQN